jgi:hypothetical protein
MGVADGRADRSESEAEIRERLARGDERETVTAIGSVHPSTIGLPVAMWV